jgi:hypothetical protein
MSSETERGPGLGARLLAILILGIAVWILLKIVIGIIAGIFWTVVAVLAVIAVFWAWRTLT